MERKRGLNKNHKELRKRHKERLTRRDFLMLMLGAVLGAIVKDPVQNLLCVLRNKFKKVKGEEVKSEVEIWLEKLKEIEAKLRQIENNDRPIKYTEEKKRELEEIEKLIQEKAEVSILAKGYLEGNLEELWNEKIELVSEKEENNENLKKDLENLKNKLLEEYNEKPKGYTNLENFENYLEYCISQTFEILDFDSLFSHPKTYLEDKQQEIFFKLINNKEFQKFFQKTLLAIILVEICHFFENAPEENKKVLNYLLNKHGLRFICSIPAIYDTRISFGPFQLTDLVIGKNQELFYPINFMNEFIKQIDEKYNLPDYSLPESIEGLRMREHFRAEILLLTYYLILLIKRSKVDILNKCFEEESRSWFLKQLSYFLAGSHHSPFIVLKNFLLFLNDRENIEKKKGFIDYLAVNKINNQLITYLERFKIHF